MCADTIGVVGYNLAAITAVVYDCDVFNTDTYVRHTCCSALPQAGTG